MEPLAVKTKLDDRPIAIPDFRKEGVQKITYIGEEGNYDLHPQKEYGVYEDRFYGPYIFGAGVISNILYLSKFSPADLENFRITKKYEAPKKAEEKVEEKVAAE